MKSQLREYDFIVTAPAVMQVGCNRYAKEINMQLNKSVIKRLN